MSVANIPRVMSCLFNAVCLSINLCVVFLPLLNSHQFVLFSSVSQLREKGNIWCAFNDVDIEMLATVNMDRLFSLSHTGLAI